MQLLKLALPLAFVSALVSVSAAPVQQRRDAVASDAQAQIARSFDYGTNPEKRLSIPFFAGYALRFLGMKEAEIDTYLTSDEGQDFVSKLASVEKRDLTDEVDAQPEKRLGPWIVGARAGLSILNIANRIVKANKEAVNDGPFDVDAFVSKLASVERRDLEVEQDHPEKRLAWALGARLGVGLLNAARRVIDSSKEAINDGTFDADKFMTSDAVKDFTSKLASVEKRGLDDEDDAQPEKRLGPWIVGARAGLSILNMANRIVKGNKEAVNDAFDIRDLLSESDVQARRINGIADLDLGVMGMPKQWFDPSRCAKGLYC